MRQKLEDGVKSYRPHPRYQKVFLQSCTVMIIVCIVCYTYVHFDGQDRVPNSFSRWNVRQVLQNAFNRLQSQKIVRERKNILLWTSFFSEVNWLPTTKELHCPVQECDVTSNRSLLANSSVIILHWRNINPQDLPSFLSSNDKDSYPLVALFNKESPSNSPREVIQNINDKIHLTITYRRDSDFFAPYGKIEERKNTFTMPKFNASKRNVCWLVSNCQTSSHREQYVNELERYIDVDIYGNCGTKMCSHQHARDCYRMLAERCKFYLSFENSICKDYATEKLFYALMFDMVPVVLGGNDYERYLPPHSFINVIDFAKPKDLANFLLETAEDEAKYLSYFKWKESHEATSLPYLWLCDLCELIHKRDFNRPKPHEDVISWWYKEANCGSL
ncbi:Fucosyltransferase C like protein [Argiope bruennichi]|uniref:Fucosyltransferase n=1 Tax=Argiope bruennichi TaxID=94029 RepID=A0A8T0FA68_ARGBR|nr:Fucosyltransferase C like protein [Argiope bruennichi]